MLMTTYQYDFIPPNTKRYDFINDQIPSVKKNEDECQCVEENKIDIPQIKQKQCDSVEWTGVAPMGRLIDPRIIPTRLYNQQLKDMNHEFQTDCFIQEPNRFLKILRTAYPDLYERLKQIPKDELNRRIERDRIYTTYQIDFCNTKEYPEGIYASLQEKDDASKLNASKILQTQKSCAELRANVLEMLAKEGTSDKQKNHDSCDKAYKPFKITFADSSRFINSGNNSHWRSNVSAKKTKFSEYMDTINKIGCVIMKNNIHDHQKCTGKHCRHQLIHACTNLK
ncbi:uncharacterized protein ACRADG_005395 [Cochliomyia hominivorax]